MDIKELSEAARQGDANAQYMLAVRYDRGEGVIQDNAIAAYWYRKAADQGCADAQHKLGGMYANGRGVAQNNDVAAQLWEKAAEQGHAEAQNDIKNVPVKIAGV